MIVVTGAARTGTSLMIQTLLCLGYKTPAKKFLPEHKGVEQYNTNGFYELYHEVINGIQHDRYKGQAVKIFPSCLNLTPTKHISKIIVCTRDMEDACKSYIPVKKVLGGPLSAKEAFEDSYIFLNEYINGINHIFINFDDIIDNPKKVILELCDFLDISPSKEQISKAIKNVNHGNISRSSNCRRFIRWVQSLSRI